MKMHLLHITVFEPTGICDAFGNSKVLPQIRDQYQVDFPTLSTKSDYLWLTSYPTNVAIVVDTPHYFLLGLPIPIMWVTDEIENIEHEPLEFLGASNKNWPVEFDDIKEDHILIKREYSELKVEPSVVLVENELCMGESVNLVLQQGSSEIPPSSRSSYYAAHTMLEMNYTKQNIKAVVMSKDCDQLSLVRSGVHQRCLC
ncbi:hypothetical protein AAG906_014295 [Vitis piasezkii]